MSKRAAIDHRETSEHQKGAVDRQREGEEEMNVRALLLGVDRVLIPQVPQVPWKQGIEAFLV